MTPTLQTVGGNLEDERELAGLRYNSLSTYTPENLGRGGGLNCQDEEKKVERGRRRPWRERGGGEGGETSAVERCGDRRMISVGVTTVCGKN